MSSNSRYFFLRVSNGMRIISQISIKFDRKVPIKLFVVFLSDSIFIYDKNSLSVSHSRFTRDKPQIPFTLARVQKGTDPFQIRNDLRQRLQWEWIQVSTRLHWGLYWNSSTQLPHLRAGIVLNPLRNGEFHCLVSDPHQFRSVPVVYTGPQLERMQTSTPWKVISNWYGWRIHIGTDPPVPV